MKTLLSILLLMTIFVAAGAVCGQAVPAKTSDAWVRFESKSKDFSIALPADYEPPARLPQDAWPPVEVGL